MGLGRNSIVRPLDVLFFGTDHFSTTVLSALIAQQGDLIGRLACVSSQAVTKRGMQASIL